MTTQELYKLYKEHPLITTDSRNCPEGSIFLALKGETFDGNRFALQALEKGCAYAIIDDRSVVETLDDTDDVENARQRLILVDDCLQTFKDLAREHRRQFNIPMVGITGTNGKTTTKELIRQVLAEMYNVMATEGNFNNDVGVPKTLFRIDDSTDIAVVEMGASHPGDIKTLVETAEPTCGLITNVGRAHLQGFGSFEGVCRTKGELYDYLLSRDLPLFVNRDNPHLMQLIAAKLSTLNSQLSTLNSPDVYYYGQSDAEEILIRGEVVECNPYLKFRWREQDRDAGYESEWMEVQTNLIGAYNLDNLLAAITVGYCNNIPFEAINHALATYTPTNNRSQLARTEHNTLIVDAYNANPTSMKAAIDNFRLIQAPRKMVILGRMGELGDVSEAEHRSIISQLQDAAFDEVWLVGDEFAVLQPPYRTFHDVSEVKDAIAQSQPQGYTILIKGSNSNHLFDLPALL